MSNLKNTINIGRDNSGEINQTIINNASKIPESISEQQFEEFLAFFENFINSKECEELRKKDYDRIAAELAEIKQQGTKSGWDRARQFLGNSANMITIGSALNAFIASHGTSIVFWIQQLFSK